jgi:3-oxoacyl-[acyl-carrier protein] reductase
MYSPSAITTNKNLQGKVAIVTGSSRGIGAAIAKQFAAEGATVAINYANVCFPSNYISSSVCLCWPQGAKAAKEVVEEIEKAGGKAHSFQADVSVRAQVLGLVEQVVKKWGRLDIFVNNSGILVQEPITATREEQVDSLLSINFKGTLWGIQAAAEVISPGGSIINVSSLVARLSAPVRPTLSPHWHILTNVP